MKIGQRLQEALDKWTGGGVMAFVGEMRGRLKESDELGYTHPAINRYLKGTSEPSEEFVRVAAKVLGVRRAWLAAEHGRMTEEEEEVAQYAATMTATAATIRIGRDSPFQPTAPEPGPEDLKRILGPVSAAVVTKLGVPPLASTARWTEGLIEVWHQMAKTAEEGTDTDAGCIADALYAPLDAFDVDPKEMEKAGALDGYVFAMIPALLAVVAEKQRMAQAKAEKRED